jgi:hypothetical protein
MLHVGFRDVGKALVRSVILGRSFAGSVHVADSRYRVKIALIRPIKVSVTRIQTLGPSFSALGVKYTVLPVES